MMCFYVFNFDPCIVARKVLYRDFLLIDFLFKTCQVSKTCQVK